MTHALTYSGAGQFAFDNTYACELEGFYAGGKAAQVVRPQDEAAEPIPHFLAEEADCRNSGNAEVSLGDSLGAPVHRWSDIEQSPHFELAISDGVANVWHGGARSHRRSALRRGGV